MVEYCRTNNLSSREINVFILDKLKEGIVEGIVKGIVEFKGL